MRPQRIADRYLVQSELGRGGMAVVYRVLDTTSGRELALKQLTVSSTERYFREQAAAFEREFHTLVQLSHPRIIEVYDFGADEGGRYYTMELLEGADLRERAPLPWREACSLIHDVCSSLALLHSRGLVHRDISPRNIRTTRDGSAKLIDFGALVPMGATAQIVGTPPFLPPEVLHRSSLDGRADLFSLGATLYFALTGRFAFQVREFSQLQEAWKRRPVPPSAMVADIPAALDTLVLSLLGLDPEVRPRTAFEVMQRLAAIASIARVEVEEVPQAYVATPVMVGREAVLAAVREKISLAHAGRASGAMLQGPAGIGRSRMLDACALDAKISGAAVVRANAGAESGQHLAVAFALATQVVETLPALALASARQEHVAELLFEAAPDAKDPDAGSANMARLRDFTARSSERAALQAALTRWLLRVAKEHPLAILVDDVQKVDEASLALLAALILGGTGRQLVLLLTAETDAAPEAAEGLRVLKRECAHFELQALTHAQTDLLLQSVFGDVPNLALLGDRVHSAAAGNPRETMMIVQWLIAHDRARYAAGAWSLPEQLETADLPATADEACQRTVAELSPLARLLGQVHALAIHKTLSREDYALAASETSAAELDRAITELLAQHVLASDGRAYVLARREWSDALTSSLDAAATEKRHRMLAAIYAKDDALAFEQIHHLLACGQEAAALDLLVKLIAVANPESDGVLSLTTLSTESIADVLDRALSSAERLARPPRETNEIRRSLFAISVYADAAHYFRTAAGFLAQLKHDSGLQDYETIDDAKDPGERLTRALGRAVERHNATPEEQRVYDAQGAIRGLVHYVAISIAVGARTQDAALLATLPGLLEPFAALSPLLHAMWQNAIATRETVIDNKPELARQRWLDVDAALSTVSSTELNYIGALRGAIAYGICLIEARLGIRSAEQRARALEEDPIQKVSATSLRRIARLHQGDFDGAERFRKRAEQLALLANQRQMFASTLTAELIAYALASDLTGIRQIADAIEPLGARFPGWRGYRQLAAGYFEQARGQFEAALVAFERGLALAEPDPRDPGRCFGSWPRLEAGLIETLVSLDRAAEAQAHGERALAICRDYAINVAGFPVRRALAMAEARLGDYENANRRLDEVIADLNAFEITGLELGVTYEARTRFAIWAGDKAAIEHYSRLTAREYRHGERSPLGARYERLMDESHRSGFFVLPELTEFHTKVTTSHWRSVETTLTKVRGSLAEASTSRERAECGLRLLCEAYSARSGHLFLYQAGSLELVASRGPSAADADLQQLVARFVSQQLRSDDVATVIEDPSPREAAQSACWLDERGAPHQFALMISEHGKSRLCAGVAVIEANAHVPVDPSARPLLVQITDELLRMGDATGITGVAL